MSSATVGLVRPPMGPGMGGPGMQPGMMDPPVVADVGGMGIARKRKRKKIQDAGGDVKPKPGKPTVGKPKAPASDPMKEIMGGVAPVKKKMEV